MLMPMRLGVDFEAPATRLERLLPQLSAVVGRTLKASVPLQEERLVIAWHSRPADDLLRDVAEVCAAEWQIDGDGLKLVRPTARERKLTQAALESRIEGVRRDLAQRPPLPAFDPTGLKRRIDGWYRGERESDEVGNDAYWSQADARDDLFDQGPGGRLTERAIRLLSPARYADVVTGERRVFSTQPTGTQKPLGSEFQALLGDFCRENDAMVSAAKGVRRAGAWSGDPTVETRTFKPSALVLEIEVLPYAGMRPYEIHVRARKTGESTDAAQGVGIAGLPEKARSAIIDATPYVPVPIPARSASERLERLRRPDLYDPMADRLLDLPQLAAMRRRDVVARVDDVMGRLAPFLHWPNAKKGLTIGAAFTRLLGENHSLRDDGGVLLIAPNDEPTHRRNDCRRDDLRTLIATFERQGYASIEAGAAFAQRNGKAAFEGLATGALAAIRPGAANSFRRFDLEGLRLYGALSAVQREAILTGGRVPMGTLSPSVRDGVSRLIANASRSAFEADLSTIRGIPPGAHLTGGESTESIAYSVHSVAEGEAYEVWDATEFGENVGMAEGQGKPYDPAEVFTKVVLGSRRTVRLKVALDARRSRNFVLSEDRFPSDAKRMGWMDLPESFRRAVRKKADAQAQVMRDYYAGRKRGAVP